MDRILHEELGDLAKSLERRIVGIGDPASPDRPKGPSMLSCLDQFDKSVTVKFEDGVEIKLSFRDGIRLASTLAREGWEIVPKSVLNDPSNTEK